MKIKFVYEGNKFVYELKYAKIDIYGVPKTYSDDGIFISDCTIKSIPSYPDCENPKLLYKALVRGKDIVEKLNLVQGVWVQ